MEAVAAVVARPETKRLAPLFWRYFMLALRSGYVERAFYLAHVLESQDMFDAIAGSHVVQQHPSVHAAVHLKVSEEVKKGLHELEAALAAADALLEEEPPTQDEVEEELGLLAADRTKLMTL